MKMALFSKQDFDPPVLSRKWIAMKFRPNMLIYSRDNIIAILESGLLFREDSIEVEQEAPDAATAWSHAGGTRGGWFTTGERNLALVATVALLLASPPRNLQRWSLVKLATCALVPLATRAAHRARCGGSLRALLALMRDYVSLTRRATACCCEYAALRATLESVSTAIQSTRTLMCRQQTEMMVLMSRASSALLGNMPWLRGDVTYEFPTDNLTKMYYAFLVVQSNLLKLIALAHHMPAARLTHIYRNHNERVYWIHNVLVHHLLQEFRQNYEALERMYRLLKNYGTRDSDSALKKQGLAVNNTWLYSEVHAGVVRSGLELKLALDKCRDLDMFLDSCASNRQQLDLEVLDRDIDGIISDVTKCLSTIHGSQMRLKKMLNRTRVEEDTQKEEDEEVSAESVVRIEDRDPEVRDEVFYCVKTDDDEITSPVGDVITGPGRREEENSKVVLTELKRKLVKREDLMRERERQALAKTLPDPRNVPEFPRQMPEECGQRKGLIARLRRNKPRRRLKRYPFKRYKIWWRVAWRRRNFSVITCKYENHSDLPDAVIDANCNHPSAPVAILTIVKVFSGFLIVVWRKTTPRLTPKDCLGIFSSGLSDVTSEPEDSTESKNTSDNHNVNRHKKISHLNDFKFSKKDLELSPSSSETDFEHLQNERVALLDDIRRHRVGRKKNFPARRASTDNADEGLKPIEYSFGTGMAMASVLQVNSNAKPHNMLQEEVFTGDGEVSNDSGNDEDA